MVTGTRCTGYRYRRFFQNCYEKELVSVRDIWYTDNEVIQMTGSTMIFVWLGLTVFFLILEGISVQLTSIWFALGAIVAMLLAVFHVDSLPVQIAAFVIVSLVTLIATRPLTRKLIDKKKQPTNADRNIGETAIVTTDIVNLEGKGEVKVKGTQWTARSADGTDISTGETVRVLRIEGVKLIVEKTENGGNHHA